VINEKLLIGIGWDLRSVTKQVEVK